MAVRSHHFCFSKSLKCCMTCITSNPYLMKAVESSGKWDGSRIAGNLYIIVSEHIGNSCGLQTMKDSLCVGPRSFILSLQNGLSEHRSASDLTYRPVGSSCSSDWKRQDRSARSSTRSLYPARNKTKGHYRHGRTGPVDSTKYLQEMESWILEKHSKTFAVDISYRLRIGLLVLYFDISGESHAVLTQVYTVVIWFTSLPPYLSPHSLSTFLYCACRVNL